MNNYNYQKLIRAYEEVKEGSDIVAFVQEKKKILRSNKHYIETAKKIKQHTEEKFKAIQKEFKKGGKLEVNLPEEWKKIMKGR